MWGTKGTPIIGVNMGRLGFLADVLPSEIESALDSLYAGDCLIEEHAVIRWRQKVAFLPAIRSPSTISPY